MILPLAILVIAAGAALQASTGMGMALFAVPLLALLDPAYVPGPMLCSLMVLSAAVAWRERDAVDGRILVVSLLGFAVGSALGAVALRLLAGIDLSWLFALLILAALALSIAGLQIEAGRVALVVGGTASGVLGTLAGVQGPPIALVLQHQRPDRLRATLCAFFAAGSAVSLTALIAAGVFGTRQAGLGLALLPGVPLGLVVAPFIARRIDRQRARLCVLVISALSALALLLR
ncbi:MAG: TSUP family transporter [Thiohalocapsa sp.]